MVAERESAGQADQAGFSAGQDAVPRGGGGGRRCERRRAGHAAAHRGFPGRLAGGKRGLDAAGSHQPGTDGDGQERSAGTPCDGSQPGGRRGAAPEALHRELACLAKVDRRAAWSVRHCGVGTGGGRDLRSDVVRRVTAMARNRHSYGTGRAAAQRPGIVISQGLRLVGIGVALGIAAAVAPTHLMSSLLFNVSAVDPLTFVGVTLLLTFASLAACYIPARRAMRVDPMVALRYE